MAKTIDINSDLGEGIGNDEAIMPFISSANIACGFHAGGPVVMERTVRLAKHYGVQIGAHPGYADAENFGRIEMQLPPEAIEKLVLHQIKTLAGIARANGCAIVHVKAHGALYNQAAKDRDYLIRISDIQDWEKANGRIPDGCILLFRTGWGKFYPKRASYLGTDRRGEQAVAELHFPGVGPEAAGWIVNNRRISILGIDTASIDRGQSQLFEVHQILFKAGICAMENVAHMDRLPTKGFEVLALPMKIQDGTGAPVRIVAILK